MPPGRRHKSREANKRPGSVRRSGFFAVIPTRKMKLNSKRFCLGDLIPFDFS